MQRRLSPLDMIMIFVLVVGCARTYEASVTVWRAISIRNWAVARAQIKHVAIYKQERPYTYDWKFGVIPDLLKRALPPYYDDSRKLDCVYGYTYGAARFSQNLISIFPQSKEKLYLHLRAAKDAGHELSCYVNPDNPYEAVLYRGPSWHSAMNDLLCLVIYFGLPGTWFGWKLHRNRRSYRMSGGNAEKPS